MLRQRSFNKERHLYEYDILDPASTVVGLAQLRTIPSKSTEMPDDFESHIYYEVKPEYRGMGYATRALRDLVEIAKSYKIVPVFTTVNADNAASIRVIENCNGRLISGARTSKGVPFLKYELYNPHPFTSLPACRF